VSLNAKQQLFVEEYLKDLNATQAAIRAGYSEKTARYTGCENLTKPNIQEAIEKAQKLRLERTQVDADYVLKRHEEIDQLDIFDIVNDDFRSLKPLSEWPKAWRTSLNGFDVSELFEYLDGEKELSGFLKKIKLPDKLKNLELMGKHTAVGAYKEQVHQTHDISDDLKELADRLPN
jgi:phage terminase small subunit